MFAVPRKTHDPKVQDTIGPRDETEIRVAKRITDYSTIATARRHCGRGASTPGSAM